MLKSSRLESLRVPSRHEINIVFQSKQYPSWLRERLPVPPLFNPSWFFMQNSRRRILCLAAIRLPATINLKLRKIILLTHPIHEEDRPQIIYVSKQAFKIAVALCKQYVNSEGRKKIKAPSFISLRLILRRNFKCVVPKLREDLQSCPDTSGLFTFMSRQK